MGEFELIEIKNEGDKTIVTHGQECKDILENAYQVRRYGGNKSLDGLGQHAGTIPMAKYLELQKLGITDDAVAFKKWFETFGKDFKTTEKKL